MGQDPPSANRAGSGDATWRTELAGKDLNLLVSLAALLEERHVTRAGLRLGFTQSTMSGLLARLRRQFHDDLLVRVGNDLKLTPLAESLLPLAQGALVEAHRTLSHGRQFEPASSLRSFVVAMSDYAQVVLVHGLAERLAHSAPGVRVEFRALPAALHIDPDATLRQHDLVVLPDQYLPSARDHSEELFSDQLVYVAATDHPGLCDGTLDEQTLANQPLLMVSLNSESIGDTTLADQHLLALGHQQVNRVRTYSHATVPFLLAGTPMVSLLPLRFAQQCAGAGLLRLLRDGSAPMHFTEAMFWHPTRSTDPGGLWLREQFAAAAAAVSRG